MYTVVYDVLGYYGLWFLLPWLPYFSVAMVTLWFSVSP